MRQILENSRMEYVSMEKEIQTLENYLELQQFRLNHASEYRIEVDEAIHPETFLIPPMLAQPFVENAIEHGFMQSKEKGLITLSYQLKDTVIAIGIEDNGIGILDARNHPRPEKPRKHSLSTVITRERLSMLHDKKKSAHFSMRDKKTMEPGSQGTIVHFYTPYKRT